MKFYPPLRRSISIIEKVDKTFTEEVLISDLSLWIYCTTSSERHLSSRLDYSASVKAFLELHGCQLSREKEKKSEELQITFEKVMKSFLNDAN